MLNMLFWIVVAIDVVALGLFLVLGLAAAGPSHTNPVAVVAFFLVPAVILLACIAMFLRFDAMLWRVAALVMAASPVLLVAGGAAFSLWDLQGYLGRDGSAHTYKAGPLRDLEAAIARDDLPAITVAARKAKLNEAGLAGVTPLLQAIRRLEKSSGTGALKALLAAGADPNATTGEFLPLTAAIYASRTAGLEPVRVLLQAGARPNQRDANGTPAYFAATGGSVDTEVLTLLLDAGADLKATDRGGIGALMHAADTRNWKVVLTMLERGADWRHAKTQNGLGLLARLESDARNFGDGKGLAEVIRFVKAAGAR